MLISFVEDDQLVIPQHRADFLTSSLSEFGTNHISLYYDNHPELFVLLRNYFIEKSLPINRIVETPLSLMIDNEYDGLISLQNVELKVHLQQKFLPKIIDLHSEAYKAFKRSYYIAQISKPNPYFQKKP